MQRRPGLVEPARAFGALAALFDRHPHRIGCLAIYGERHIHFFASNQAARNPQVDLIQPCKPASRSGIKDIGFGSAHRSGDVGESAVVSHACAFTSYLPGRLTWSKITLWSEWDFFVPDFRTPTTISVAIWKTFGGRTEVVRFAS